MNPAEIVTLGITPQGRRVSDERPRDLSELRDFIRSRRAALFGFMEQGAALELHRDVLTVIPRNDIYVRYLQRQSQRDCRSGDGALRVANPGRRKPEYRAGMKRAATEESPF